MAAKREIQVGQRFGELVITGRAPNVHGSGGCFVFARCDCGSEGRYRLRALEHGVSRCSKRSHYDAAVLAAGEEIVGQRFGLLTVVAASAERYTSKGGSRSAQVQVQCDCGNKRYARITDLKGGGCRSCGECTKVAPVAKRWEVHGKRGTYALEAVGTGLVKIGSARNIKDRMLKLQHPCPVELKLIAWSDDDVERPLHLLLTAHRAHGEWFRLVPEVASAIAEKLQPTEMSVMGDLGRPGLARAGKHKCKRCGQLGHHAKTCARDIGDLASAA